jgi:hypothetical protein
MSLINRTAGLRHRIIWGVAKVLSPKLHKDLKEALSRGGLIPRPFTLFLKRTCGTQALMGAEIGFGLGYNAANLLGELNLKKLYCIDPLIGKVYRDSKGKRIDIYTKPNLKHLLERDPRVEFIEKPSDAALKGLSDLDFVYVDGDHRFDQVLRDLEGSMKAVKWGGYVGGHDFHYHHQGVIGAITCFANSTKRIPKIEPPDFWFVKR